MHQRATNHSDILWLLGIKIGEKQYFFYFFFQACSAKEEMAKLHLKHNAPN